MKKKNKKAVGQEELANTEAVSQDSADEIVMPQSAQQGYFDQYYRAYKNDYIDQYLNAYRKLKQTRQANNTEVNDKD